MRRMGCLLSMSISLSTRISRELNPPYISHRSLPVHLNGKFTCEFLAASMMKGDE